MKYCVTSKGNFLVEGRRVRGVDRWAYFSQHKRFIRYADPLEWAESINEWQLEVHDAIPGDFKFPPLSAWKLRSTVETDAGRFLLFWRWCRGRLGMIPCSKVNLNNKALVYKEHQNIRFTDILVNRINLIHEWNKGDIFDGIFDYADAINYGFDGDGWLMPTVLINLCFITNFEHRTVYRAINMIGLQEPKQYRLSELKKEDANNKPFGLNITLETDNAKAHYVQYLNDEKADNYGGNLESLNISGSLAEIFSALLWVFLYPIREKYENFDESKYFKL